MTQELGDYERRRYARQLALPGWDVAAQVRLADATVCILGATPEAAATALALAGAGVGTLVIDAGLGDVPARVAALTTLCAVRVGAQAAVAGADAVVEAGAGAAARAALDAWARQARVPWVVAVSDGWDAQVAVLDQRVAGAPCARCVWPAPDERAESDAPAAPVAAWAGALAALEVVKLLGQGGSAGHAWLMLLSGLAGDVRRLRLRRAPGCPAHGDAGDAGGSPGASADAGAGAA
ncbi:MAG: ThiF family adenylyltransferase [Deltaproteobacteria bacterium]|nr:ThiF family adenylyltransferase [Deltaproteobacteria bacterium]